MRGKWAAGIEPRNFTWVYEGRLAVSERPGGSTLVHRRVRRDEELLWLKRFGFTRIISILPAGQNLGRNSSSSRMMDGPPARCIAPSTPPPPASAELAAFTIASTATLVMSPSISRSTAPFANRLVLTPI